jgi:hypothetical protein
MRLPVALVLVLGALVAAPTSAEPVGPDGFCGAPARIDFETGIPQIPLIPGVRFLFESIPGAPDWFAGVPTRVGSGFLYGPPFDAQAYGNLVASTNPLSFSHMAIEFTTPQRTVGAWVGSIPNFLETSTTVLTVRVRDAGGLLLDQLTVPVPPLGEAPSFVGFHDEAGIARIEWLNDSGGFFGVDNVLYGAPASDCVATLEIPTASRWAMALLALGLATLALRRLTGG